jgi:hypothetical protein
MRRNFIALLGGAAACWEEAATREGGSNPQSTPLLARADEVIE